MIAIVSHGPIAICLTGKARCALDGHHGLEAQNTPSLHPIFCLPTTFHPFGLYRVYKTTMRRI